MYLLDTNVCIDFARARSERLRLRIRAQNGHGMALSAITLGELRFGARRTGGSEDEHLVEMLVSILPILDFDRAAAEAYGRLGADVRVRRHSFDRLIAAHAIASDCVLVTNNERDFADIAGLHVENWAA